MKTVAEIIRQIWSHQTASVEAPPLDRLTLTGAEPALPSSFRVGAFAQAALAANGLMASEIWRDRTGRVQQVAVDMAHAAAEMRSERYFTVDGGPPLDPWDKIAGAYRTGDGRFIRIHTNFAHHRDGVLGILGCAYDRGAVQRALMDWSAEAFETEATARGLVVAMARTFEEWDAHPHAQAMAAVPFMEIERIGAAPPIPFPERGPFGEGLRPLSGVRVLEATRIIAGPVGGRTLAAQGADVLLMTGPHLPSIPSLVIDTGRGKRSTQLDLRAAGDRETLDTLLREADVFLHGYRPGGFAERGYSAERVAALRPGIVQAEINAYGWVGPWAPKRGFDSLVQAATGINLAEAEAAGEPAPRPLPAQSLDHVSGYLLSFGIMAALRRRAVEGGSWRVRVSLAQTGRWLRSLGRLADGLTGPDPKIDEIAGYRERTASEFGLIDAVRPSVWMSETPPAYARPPVPLGHDRPSWSV
jgi:crotonobetainyl-CoA:carnitine CoA-transferase CaiB-like acyl-CoA transferase